MAPPPIVLPEELGITVEDIFHPLDRSLVPQVADLIDWLEKNEPDVLAGVADVDRSLIWGAMEEAPLQRLANNSRHARGLKRLQRAFERNRRAAV